MNYLKFGTIILALCLSSFTYNHKHHSLNNNSFSRLKYSSVLSDKEQIQNLIRKVLDWSQSKNSIDLLPVLTNSKGVCVGFDMQKLKINLDKLKATGFFSAEFINNYDQIILTLDKKLQRKELESWSTGELPTFGFANDVDPWCLCQDNLDWNNVEVKVINLNAKKGELYWNWGKLGSDVAPDWKQFKYKFRVIKEGDTWKISYLQGFDFKNATKKG